MPTSWSTWALTSCPRSCSLQSQLKGWVRGQVTQGSARSAASGVALPDQRRLCHIRRARFMAAAAAARASTATAATSRRLALHCRELAGYPYLWPLHGKHTLRNHQPALRRNHRHHYMECLRQEAIFATRQTAFLPVWMLGVIFRRRAAQGLCHLSPTKSGLLSLHQQSLEAAGPTKSTNFLPCQWASSSQVRQAECSVTGCLPSVRQRGLQALRHCRLPTHNWQCTASHSPRSLGRGMHTARCGKGGAAQRERSQQAQVLHPLGVQPCGLRR